ncbi:hypothetical protein L195_g047966 [Trifolium pratense]|uniref:Uncharacterized protein n=1 Tax=Trifolium pratense TaxID=57577 RepID=A0A2K3JJY2_TRIPR|nr:hypothetical protein L195_g047966 [Trifolium pratense]
MLTTARKVPGITNDGRKYCLGLPCCIGPGCPFPPPPPIHANAMMANAAAAPTSHMDK